MVYGAASTSDDSGLSAVVIAIIVIVCVLVLLAVIIIVVCCIRKKIRQDQSQSQKTTEESNVKPGMKGTKRPKSSNDLDSARLINEQNKAKLAKKLAKKKETRTIAVQASIWTAPIKRTTTALSTEPLRSNSQSSLKFIPYIRKQVVIAKPPVEMNNVTRSKTTLEHNNHNSKHPTVTRAKTTLDKNDGVTKHVPKYLVKKNTVNNPRQKILRHMSVISRHSTDYYANEFERRFPFPNEGNPNEYHNTLDIPDETEGFQDTDVNQPSITAPKDNAQSIKKEREVGFRVENLNHRENTKNSLRSRPSTTDGVLGVKLKNTPGSIRKTYSEGTDHSKSILKFSYNSPYAMSEAQKNYSLQKAAWIRHQISKDLHNKKHIEQMIKLEGERAFDKWVINKRKSISVTRRKYSKTSFKTHKTDSSVTGSSKTDDTVKESSNDAVESIKDGLNTVESVNNISNS
ncbi:uncharacterized protein LOC132718417 [Ruditapes philippinarum]|uniref:uncharacterized protein LOC132718417 n=1 Tax=Ruditapes philippinarum TaxID=129788 RepID=UPI00295BB663|nr:uncharacterized protein LOC132718417 [Ruditapes philippinarum]